MTENVINLLQIFYKKFYIRYDSIEKFGADNNKEHLSYINEVFLYQRETYQEARRETNIALCVYYTSYDLKIQYRFAELHIYFYLEFLLHVL